jgi:hypothetical protein
LSILFMISVTFRPCLDFHNVNSFSVLLSIVESYECYLHIARRNKAKCWNDGAQQSTINLNLAQCLAWWKNVHTHTRYTHKHTHTNGHAHPLTSQKYAHSWHQINLFKSWTRTSLGNFSYIKELIIAWSWFHKLVFYK